jgi:hypothetical protein
MKRKLKISTENTEWLVKLEQGVLHIPRNKEEEEDNDEGGKEAIQAIWTFPGCCMYFLSDDKMNHFIIGLYKISERTCVTSKRCDNDDH